MGIRLVEAKLLIDLCHKVQRMQGSQGFPFLAELKICSLGFPDFLFNIDELSDFLSGRDLPESFLSSLDEIDYKSDLASDAFTKYQNYVNPLSFFKYFNAKLDIVDICKHRGNEKVVDLNIPNSTFLLENKYDIVIDNGTLEHCFNVGEALLNTARMVKSNGFVFHINPLSMINHGFFNICPTFLYDFYDQNNFEIIMALATSFESMRIQEIDPLRRVKLDQYFGSEELIMNFIVRSSRGKSTDKCRDFVYPIQSKYKHSLKKL